MNEPFTATSESFPATKPRKKLNARQALKIKRNKIQGRINKLRSDLADLEPVLAKVQQRLQQMDQSNKEQQNDK
jgi:hypothetical protein